MRLIRISLAAKYRVLFGLAVLLIIGAALCVPWMRMEALVLEGPFEESRRSARDHFELLGEPDRAAGTRGGFHRDGFGVVVDSSESQPQFISRRAFHSPLVDAAPGGPLAASDPFVERAFDAFEQHPNRQVVLDTRVTNEERRSLYAYAVRATKSCLTCHGEGMTAPTVYRENELAGVVFVDLPGEEAGRGLIWNRFIIIAAGALAGTLAILVFYIITHRFILAPINELRGVAMRVADGNLDVRSTLKTGDEFEQLADSMNTMLERLRVSQEELKNANRLLDQKLGEIAETNVALYESNRLKSEFLANVSHELRTPLTSIIGFAELLREDPLGADAAKAARYSENILISGRILLEIINDLLDLAKIEAGKIELHIGEVQLAELCTTLIAFTRPLADKKRLEVVFKSDADLPVMQSDRGRLRQILFNLLSNAVKFTPEGGVIRVVAQRVAEDRVRVSVVDSGPGISPEHQAIIFDKFRQIDQSATREHHGTGLGLAIAKDLTTLLGGTINLVSEPGHGATFTVEFPTAAPQPPERTTVAFI